jgi:hypothetical protein
MQLPTFRPRGVLFEETMNRSASNERHQSLFQVHLPFPTRVGRQLQPKVSKNQSLALSGKQTAP